MWVRDPLEVSNRLSHQGCIQCRNLRLRTVSVPSFYSCTSAELPQGPSAKASTDQSRLDVVTKTNDLASSVSHAAGHFNLHFPLVGLQRRGKSLDAMLAMTLEGNLEFRLEAVGLSVTSSPRAERMADALGHCHMDAQTRA